MSHRFTRSLRAAAVLAAGALTLSACGGGSSDGPSAGTEDDPIIIGVVTEAEPYWEIFSDLAQEEGIYVEFKNFTDYQLPNQGLADGDLDLNQFQHLQFLAGFNVNAGQDLAPIGATAVYPLGLFSKKHANLADIPEGGEIAIPNDATNQARALLVLQDAGLLKLEDGGNSFSTPFEIIAEESKVTVRAIDASQTATVLDDVDGSIINNDWLGKANLTAEDAIFADDPHSAAAEPYINVFVSRAADTSNETFLKLIEIYHDATVEASVQETAGGTAAFLNTPAADLQKILTGIEANIEK